MMKKIWFFFSFILISLLAGCLPIQIPAGKQVEQQTWEILEKTSIETSSHTPQEQSWLTLPFQAIVKVDAEKKHTERERDLIFKGDLGTHTAYLTLPFQLKRELMTRFPDALFVGNILAFEGEVQELATDEEKTEYQYEIVSVKTLKVLKSIFDLTPKEQKELEKRKQILTTFLIKRITEPQQQYYFLDTMDGSGKRSLLGLSQEPLWYDWKDCKLDKIGNYLVKGKLVSKKLNFCLDEEGCDTKSLEETWSLVPADPHLPELCSFGLPLGQASGDQLIGEIGELRRRSNGSFKRRDSISHFAGMQGKSLRPLVNDGKEHTFRVFSFLTEGYEGYSAKSSVVLDWEILE